MQNVEESTLPLAETSPSKLASSLSSLTLPLAHAGQEAAINGEPCPFRGRVVEFPDGSRWQIGEPLSRLALQQKTSPCEARQVYAATCLADPEESYDEMEAVVKIKFQ